MVSATLAVVATLHVVTGAAFMIVGRTLARRRVQNGDTAAVRAFALWWMAMGLYMVLRAALTAYAAAGQPHVVPFLIGRVLGIALLVVAVWGLVFHILYLYTGRRGIAWPLALLYGGLGVAFYVAGFWPVPDEVVVRKWDASLEGEGATTLYRIVYGAIGFTILASALAYLSLIRTLQDPLQRLRVVLVSGSLFLWVSTGLAAFLSTNDLARFVVLVFLGLATAAAVLIAYHPPGFLKNRLLTPRPPPRHARTLQERARLLV